VSHKLARNIICGQDSVHLFAKIAIKTSGIGSKDHHHISF